MLILFATNFLNPHQLPLCEAFLKLEDVDFYFIATTPTPEERLKLGFDDMNNKYDFVVKAYENDKEYQRATDLISKADIVIYGSCLIDCRALNKNGLLLQHSERLFKKGFYQMKNPLFNYKLAKQYKTVDNEYFLSASAYLKKDFKFLNINKNRIIKWGYFTELCEYDDSYFEKKYENNEPIKILWSGRMLDWKRPIMALEVGKHLKERGINFKLEMVGTGPEAENINKYIVDNELEDYVINKGPLPYKEVRKKMEEAQIFLFTSTTEEGWGAVLNEAMNSGCVCIASEYAGSTNCLIEDGVNGYKFKTQKELNSLVEKAISSNNMKDIGIKAYKTIKNVWNAEEAVKRLIDACKDYHIDKTIHFYDGEGPGSNDW